MTTKIEIREDLDYSFNSSVLAHASLDKEKRVLVVSFIDDSIACYSDVSEELFNSFANAASAGKFYNAYIKGRKPSHNIHIIDFNNWNIIANTDDKDLVKIYYGDATAAPYGTEPPAENHQSAKEVLYRVSFPIAGMEASIRLMTLVELNAFIAALAFTPDILSRISIDSVVSE